MNVTILEKKESPLLSRAELIADIEFDKSTPSNTDVAKQLAALNKTEEGLVKIKKIATKFGAKKATVTAVIYTSKEAFDKVERKSRKSRRDAKEAAAKAKKEAEQPAQA
jgi:ribosomal protein S24E